MALYFMNIENRASPADFTAAAAAALLPFALDQEAQLHWNSLRVQVSSWHSALQFQEAELTPAGLTSAESGGSVHIICSGPRKAQLHQMTQRYRSSVCCGTLCFQKLHQRTLRYRILSWHSALQFQEAGLLQQTCTAAVAAALFIIIMLVDQEGLA